MSFQLPEHIVLELVDRLGADDAFRLLFARNPREALGELGFEPARDPTVAQGIWMCMKVDELASKEAIRASSDTLRRQLTTRQAAMMPITLEVCGGKSGWSSAA